MLNWDAKSTKTRLKSHLTVCHPSLSQQLCGGIQIFLDSWIVAGSSPSIPPPVGQILTIDAKCSISEFQLALSLPVSLPRSPRKYVNHGSQQCINAVLWEKSFTQRADRQVEFQLWPLSPAPCRNKCRGLRGEIICTDEMSKSRSLQWNSVFNLLIFFDSWIEIWGAFYSNLENV